MTVHELFAYLRLENASKAIDFYREAFGAKEKFRLTEPGGRIGHEIEKISPAEMQRRYDEMTKGS